MEKIGGGAPTLLIIGAHVSIHLQYVYVIAMLIKKAVHIVVLMYQLEVEKKLHIIYSTLFYRIG